MITDSERFYASILKLFDDIDEQQEVQELRGILEIGNAATLLFINYDDQ